MRFQPPVQIVPPAQHCSSRVLVRLAPSFAADVRDANPKLVRQAVGRDGPPDWRGPSRAVAKSPRVSEQALAVHAAKTRQFGTGGWQH